VAVRALAIRTAFGRASNPLRSSAQIAVQIALSGCAQRRANRGRRESNCRNETASSLGKTLCPDAFARTHLQSGAVSEELQ
jgi:hypothetical protein